MSALEREAEGVSQELEVLARLFASRRRPFEERLERTSRPWRGEVKPNTPQLPSAIDESVRVAFY